MRVAALQIRPGTPVARVGALMAATAADVHALPEYWTARPSESSPAETALHHAEDLAALLALASRSASLVLGGTVVRATAAGLHNLASLFRGSSMVGEHRKVHPTARERAGGIIPGAGFRTFDCGGLRVATLICADVLAPGSFALAGRGNPDLVFVPATSPLRPAESLEAKEERDRQIFMAGAVAARAFVIKACAAGEVYGGPLQGRSLIAAPWGEFLARVPAAREADERVLAAELDLERLQAWRLAASR